MKGSHGGIKKKTKLACAPNVVHPKSSQTQGETCFSHTSLKKIAKAFNKAHSNDPNFKPIKLYNSKDKLWKEIESKMHSQETCVKEGEWCWVEQPFAKQIKDPVIHKYTFKPPIPIGKYDWLSTRDIDNVLFQYEKVFPEFKFLGTWPIDFQSLKPRHFDLDLEKLKIKGIN